LIALTSEAAGGVWGLILETIWGLILEQTRQLQTVLRTCFTEHGKFLAQTK